MVYQRLVIKLKTPVHEDTVQVHGLQFGKDFIMLGINVPEYIAAELCTQALSLVMLIVSKLYVINNYINLVRVYIDTHQLISRVL